MIGKQLDLFGGPPKPPKKITIDEEQEPVPVQPQSGITDSNTESGNRISPHENSVNDDISLGEETGGSIHVQMPEAPIDLPEESLIPENQSHEGNPFIEVVADLQDIVIESEEEEISPAIEVLETGNDDPVLSNGPAEDTLIEGKVAENDNIEEIIKEQDNGQSREDSDVIIESEQDEVPVMEIPDSLVETQGSELEPDADFIAADETSFVEDLTDTEVVDQPTDLIRDEEHVLTEAGDEAVTQQSNTEIKDMDEPAGEAVAEGGVLNIPADQALYSRQYYTMRETAAMFSVNQSLLRFWENEFDILKPKKNRKGDRYFRPDDIKNLELIYHLLKVRKFTIGGAKDYLKSRARSLDTFEMVQRLEKIKHFLLELKTHL